jgi:hypothetical protein
LIVVCCFVVLFGDVLVCCSLYVVVLVYVVVVAGCYYVLGWLCFVFCCVRLRFGIGSFVHVRFVSLVCFALLSGWLLRFVRLRLLVTSVQFSAFVLIPGYVR